MRILRLILVSAIFLAFTLPCLAQAQTAPLNEKAKIEALIKAVSQLKTGTFVRNGSSYNADTAANFLRKKWEANDSAIKTARDFIDKIGSRGLIVPMGLVGVIQNYISERIK